MDKLNTKTDNPTHSHGTLDKTGSLTKILISNDGMAKLKMATSRYIIFVFVLTGFFLGLLVSSSLSLLDLSQLVNSLNTLDIAPIMNASEIVFQISIVLWYYFMFIRPAREIIKDIDKFNKSELNNND